MSLGFPREARVTRGAELQHIAREGKRIRTRHLEVRAAASPFTRPIATQASCCRIGLIVPRFKHTAVDRNLVKRRLRELGRLYLLPAQFPADIVIRIRPEAYSAPFAVLKAEVMAVLEQLSRWYPVSTDHQLPAAEE